LLRRVRDMPRKVAKEPSAPAPEPAPSEPTECGPTCEHERILLFAERDRAAIESIALCERHAAERRAAYEYLDAERPERQASSDSGQVYTVPRALSWLEARLLAAES